MLHWMGVIRPTWDDVQLDTRLKGFDYLVQNHFRYYEFCGNTIVAMLWAYIMNRFLGTVPFLGTGTDFATIILSVVLFAASRDALAKYYRRTGRLLGELAQKGAEGAIMFNGNNHEREVQSPRRTRREKKPKPKAQTLEKQRAARARADST